MGGKSKSVTSSKNNNVQTDEGFQIVDSDNSSIIVSDHDAINKSFDFAGDTLETLNSSVDRVFEFGTETVSQSFEYADRANERAEVIADNALSTVGNAAKVAQAQNAQTTKSLENLALTLKTGDLKTTQTMVLGGVALTVVAIAVAIAVKGKNK